jgi:DeoR/GlpR family transcriptional regulator of sugar metabolism
MTGVDPKDGRAYRVLKYLQDRSREGGEVKLEAVRQYLGVSTNTARKDLATVLNDFGEQQEGELRYVPIQLLLDPRLTAPTKAKEEIVNQLVPWLTNRAGPFWQWYLDGGTTCRVAHDVFGRNPPGGPLATLYTNDVSIGAAAARSQLLKTTLLPGEVTRNSTIVGRDAESFVSARKFDMAVLSCSEVLVHSGRFGLIVLVSTAATNEVALKQGVIRASNEAVLLAEADKVQPSSEEQVPEPIGAALEAAKTAQEAAASLARLLRFTPFCVATEQKVAGKPRLFVEPFDLNSHASPNGPARPFHLFIDARESVKEAFRTVPGALNPTESEP